MPKITYVDVYIAEDSGPDDEGIPAVMMVINGNNYWMPLIASDAANLEGKRRYAQELANSLEKELKLCRFSVREVIDVVKPEKERA